MECKRNRGGRDRTVKITLSQCPRATPTRCAHPTAGQVVHRNVNPSPQTRQARLVCRVEVSGPLQLDRLAGTVLDGKAGSRRNRECSLAAREKLRPCDGVQHFRRCATECAVPGGVAAESRSDK